MGDAAPKCLLKTMTKELAYKGLKASGHLMDLPEMDQSGNIVPTIGAVGEVSRIHPNILKDIIEEGTTEAHRLWRSQPEVLALMRKEECLHYQNYFAQLEVAGPKPSMIWFWHIYKILKPLGASFELNFPVMRGPDYSQQFAWLTDIDCLIPPMFKIIFLERRKRLAEALDLKEIIDLYSYALSPGNDVMGLAVQDGDSPEVLTQKRLNRPLFYEDGEQNISYLLMRSIVVSNGKGAPITW